jgi:hypothetical protein
LAKKTTIKWTDKQQKVNALLDQGKTRQEILQAGYAKTTIDDVIAARKSKRKEGGEGGNPPPPPPPPPGDRLKPQVLDLVEIGGLYIEPANWRISQRGVYLIMDTHERAKETFNYEGTLGEFLCDCVQAMRNLMGVNLMDFDYFIKEDNNGGKGQEGTRGGLRLLGKGGNGTEQQTGPEPSEVS